jgi:CubicO group peptidase (beta-lactamase class C family)
MSARTWFSKARSMRCPILALSLTAFTACAHPTRSAPAAYSHAAESIGTVRQMYDGRLTPDLAAQTFRNIDRLFPSRVIARGHTVSPLPLSATPITTMSCTSAGRTIDLDEYMRLNRVSGLLVLDHGRIALERYALGAGPQTRWMSMSMAKSITSTLIAIALRDGKITSLDDKVTTYVPALNGSAYDGVTVRNILMMASGVRWNETYTDSTSDRRHLLDVQIAQRPGAAIALMASLPRAVAPGSVLNYSTGETLVAGEVLRGAVGKSLSEYLSEKIWKPVGMESDATWWLDSPDGHEIGGSGITATLRDYGRFGLFFMRGGVIGRDTILPAGWLADAGSPKTLTTGKRQAYGYMWWPVEAASASVNDGAFAAQGIFGQWLYINPRQQLVIVQWSAQTQPSGGDVLNPEDCFGAIATQLMTR